MGHFDRYGTDLLCSLLLKGRPTLRQVPETQEAASGSEVTLPCSVAGHPQPVIAWTKDGQPLPRGTCDT